LDGKGKMDQHYLRYVSLATGDKLAAPKMALDSATRSDGLWERAHGAWLTLLNGCVLSFQHVATAAAAKDAGRTKCKASTAMELRLGNP
jgi:hypothetical protein